MGKAILKPWAGGKGSPCETSGEGEPVWSSLSHLQNGCVPRGGPKGECLCLPDGPLSGQTDIQVTQVHPHPPNFCYSFALCPDHGRQEGILEPSTVHLTSL